MFLLLDVEGAKCGWGRLHDLGGWDMQEMHDDQSQSMWTFTFGRCASSSVVIYCEDDYIQGHVLNIIN